MAIIKCYECGKDVSDKAAACPHCGAPYGEDESLKDDKQEKHTSKPPIKTEDAKKKEREAAVFALIMLVIFFILAYFFDFSIPVSIR